MKIRSGIYLFALACIVLISSCQKGNLPSNPTLISPVNSLVLQVDTNQVTAVPEIVNGLIGDTLTVNVEKQSYTAKVTQISLAQSGAISTLAVGQTITFVNNMASFKVTANGTTTTYFIKISFTPPPIMYVPLSSAGYVVTPGTTQTIASANYDNNYEGYINFSISWLGFYVVTNTNPEVEYGVNAGFSSGTTLTLQQTTSAAPWGDWGSNSIWKFNYNATTLALTLLQTNWGITGSATGNSVDVMTYSPTTKLFTLTANLSPGNFMFTAQTSPTLEYGDASTTVQTGSLISNGAPIAIAAAGSYTITMNLMNPPFYAYTVTKN